MTTSLISTPQAECLDRAVPERRALKNIPDCIRKLEYFSRVSARPARGVGSKHSPGICCSRDAGHVKWGGGLFCDGGVPFSCARPLYAYGEARAQGSAAVFSRWRPGYFVCHFTRQGAQACSNGLRRGQHRGGHGPKVLAGAGGGGRDSGGQGYSVLVAPAGHDFDRLVLTPLVGLVPALAIVETPQHVVIIGCETGSGIHELRCGNHFALLRGLTGVIMRRLSR